MRGRPTRWSSEELDQGYAVVLLRRGGFARRAEGEEAFVDPSGGYLSRHGVPEQFAFPLAGPYRCTVVGLTAAAYRDWVEPVTGRSWWLATDGRFDLRHGLLLAAARAVLEDLARPVPPAWPGSPPGTGSPTRRT